VTLLSNRFQLRVPLPGSPYLAPLTWLGLHLARVPR
jgi:hypothetical protein